MAQLLKSPTKIAKDHYLLQIKTNSENSQPGQFINIKTNSGNDPLLRRPFSIFDHNNDIIEIVIKIIGKGTTLIKNKQPGEIDILGPLGNGFSLIENKSVLLAGGGVGNAPLFYLAKKLNQLNNSVHMIYGTRSNEYIYMLDKFEKVCETFTVCTDDGSCGTKQFVHQAIEELQSTVEYDKVYTCGPTIMMQHVVNTVNPDIPVEVSVENYFGCGIGLCVGCTVQTTEGQKRACLDGPTFDGRSIIWDSIGDA